MRLKSGIWVAAYLRRCNIEGAFAAVRRRGAEEAGAVFININRLDGTATLVWAGAADAPSTRRSRPTAFSPPCSAATAPVAGSRYRSAPGARNPLRSRCLDRRDRGPRRAAFPRPRGGVTAQRSFDLTREGGASCGCARRDGAPASACERARRGARRPNTAARARACGRAARLPPDRQHALGRGRREFVIEAGEIVDPLDRLADRRIEEQQNALEHGGLHAERLGGDHDRLAGRSRAMRSASARLMPSARSSMRQNSPALRCSAAFSRRRITSLEAGAGRRAVGSAAASRLVRIRRRSSVLAAKNSSARSCSGAGFGLGRRRASAAGQDGVRRACARTAAGAAG